MNTPASYQLTEEQILSLPAPDYTLVKHNYHLKDVEELARIGDAESVYERGIQVLFIKNRAQDIELGWLLLLEAAVLGHPAAQVNLMRQFAPVQFLSLIHI